MKKTTKKRQQQEELASMREYVLSAHPYALTGAMSVRSMDEVEDDLRLGDEWDPEYDEEQTAVGDEATAEDGLTDDIEIDVKLGTLQRTFRFSGSDAVDFASFCRDVRLAAFAPQPQLALLEVLELYSGIRLAVSLKEAIESDDYAAAKSILGGILSA